MNARRGSGNNDGVSERRVSTPALATISLVVVTAIWGSTFVVVR
jgi:hypothetical protein